MRRGILWTAYHALCYSHKIEDIEYTLSCYDNVMSLFSDIVDKKKKLRPQIKGTPVKPVFRRVADFMSYTIKEKN